MLPAEARQQLGTGFIIGGTCNTFEDVMQVKDSVDYIGCGPFRFTTTKQGLAPVLGLDGYRNIVWQCRSNGINLPMVAIGGITRQDIPDVLNAGPNGVAVSGPYSMRPTQWKKPARCWRLSMPTLSVPCSIHCQIAVCKQKYS